MSDKSNGRGFFGFILIILFGLITFYTLTGVFKYEQDGIRKAQVFFLEAGFAATSGFVAPINSWYRNKDSGYYEWRYQEDMSAYATVYQTGLERYPLALVLGDLFGSTFSILSAIAFFFAIKSSVKWGAFKILFWTEIIEESLYYMNVYRMTGVFDVGPIDIGVTLTIAFIVAGIGEYTRRKRNR